MVLLPGLSHSRIIDNLKQVSMKLTKVKGCTILVYIELLLLHLPTNQPANQSYLIFYRGMQPIYYTHTLAMC